VILELLDEATDAGARLSKACDVVGLSMRSVERWRAHDAGGSDGRAGPLAAPSHKLTAEERQALLAVANSPEFRSKSPRQIVPTLADRGEYIASESTFYRVLHEEGQMAHRDRARPRSSRRPEEKVARAPNQVWCWDITYLRSSVRGAFFYLYMVLDIYSRKIVGWWVADHESMDVAADLIESSTREHNVPPDTLVLHADNGGPMKGSTMLAKLHALGVLASFSRPRVSDDNPYAEALFRTLKYRPGYPRKPFACIDAARAWVAGFVAWYNAEHLHSALRYVTPDERHAGFDRFILAARHHVYQLAHARAPRRWSRQTRNWTPVGPVTLTPATRTCLWRTETPGRRQLS
jgi:transposase InsO family protein